jgi:hypothetical protein
MPWAAPAIMAAFGDVIKQEKLRTRGINEFPFFGSSVLKSSHASRDPLSAGVAGSANATGSATNHGGLRRCHETGEAALKLDGVTDGFIPRGCTSGRDAPDSRNGVSREASAPKPRRGRHPARSASTSGSILNRRKYPIALKGKPRSTESSPARAGIPTLMVPLRGFEPRSRG